MHRLAMLRFREGFTPSRIASIDNWLENTRLDPSLGDVLPYWFGDLGHMACVGPKSFLESNKKFENIAGEISAKWTDLQVLYTFCERQNISYGSLLEVGSLARAVELSVLELRKLGVDLRLGKVLAKQARLSGRRACIAIAPT
jgi:hypothetical protein